MVIYPGNVIIQGKGIESLSQTLISNSYIFAVKCCRHLTFQTVTSVRSKNISLKYQRFTTQGSTDIGIKNQNLWQGHNSLVPKLKNLQRYLFQAYTSLKPSRVKQNHTLYYQKWLKLIIEIRSVNFKLIIMYANQFLIILVFIFEHIPILKQLPHFSSCRVFGTYNGFETITHF